MECSRNALSYLPTRKGWMRFFNYQCQTRHLAEQYERGMRCFEVGVRFHDGRPFVARGLAEYDIDVHHVLSFLDERKGVCVVLMWENHPWSGGHGEFLRFAREARERYTHTDFIVGMRYPYAVLYTTRKNVNVRFRSFV